MVAAGEAPLIPAEYQQVEYIESLSTTATGPFFNTGYNPTMTGDLILEVDCMTTKKATIQYPIGVNQPGTSSNVGAGVYFMSSGTTIAAWIGVSVHLETGEYTNTRWQLTGVFRNGSPGFVSISDGEHTASLEVESPRAYNGLPVCLFGVKKRTSQQVSSPLKGRIYHARVTENGVIQRDMYPCYRKSDGTPGFFDVITKTFKTRSGSSTATITVGPEV